MPGRCTSRIDPSIHYTGVKDACIMPVEIAVLQIANSLLVPIWKLTNTCFIALPHAKSIFLPTQHKSVTYIILPGYSKSPEAGVHTCVYLAFRIRWGSEFSDILGKFPNIPKQFFFFFFLQFLLFAFFSLCGPANMGLCHASAIWDFFLQILFQYS